MGKERIILCDSGVFFQSFRKNEKVLAELDKIEPTSRYLSAITVGEIYFGMKTTEKRETIELINRFSIIHLDKVISKKFTSLMLAYLDRRIGIPDAIIAATALTHKAELFTFNRKDFSYIEGIKLYNPTQMLP